MVGWESVSGFMITAALGFTGLLFSAGIAGLAYWMAREYQKWKQFKCYIFITDGLGKTIITEDTAGVFLDSKTNTKRFFLKKARTSLNADQVPSIKVGKKNIVFLVRKGLKNFRYISPEVTKGTELAFLVGEEDVNWAVNSYESAKKAFYTNKWLEYAPMIMFTISVIGIIVLLIVLFKNFDTIKIAAASFEAATKNVAVAKATMV